MLLGCSPKPLPSWDFCLWGLSIWMCHSSGQKSENYAIFGIWERPASAIYIHKYLLAKFEIAAECYHLSSFKNTFNRYIYQNLNIFDKKFFDIFIYEPFNNIFHEFHLRYIRCIKLVFKRTWNPNGYWSYLYILEFTFSLCVCICLCVCSILFSFSL